MVPTRMRWASIAFVVLLSAWLASSGMTSRNTDPTWSSLVLYVPDLDCTFWCSVKVNAAMETIDGASADRLDPSQRILSIRFDPQRATPEAIVAGLRARGIRVATSKDEPVSELVDKHGAGV